MNNHHTVSLLGYTVSAESRDFFLNDIKGIVDCLNPHSHVQAKKDPLFMEALRNADYLVADGVGIQMAARLLTGKKIPKIAGSDLHEIFIQSLAKSKGSCYYLGSSENTLNKIKERLSREFPEIRVGTYSPPFKPEFSDTENEEMINAINTFSPDILFIGMTAPKQEKWAYRFRHRINSRIICPVGAVFDFYAGTVKRPGSFWISLGLEWLPRLLREPARLWKRTFISTPLFVLMVLKTKIKISAGSTDQEVTI